MLLTWASVMSHLDYLTDFLTSSGSILSTHSGHFNYNCDQDHVTPLLKTIECILMTTKTRQNDLQGPENPGHILSLQAQPIAGTPDFPNPSPVGAQSLAQAMLILPGHLRSAVPPAGALLPDIT